MEDAGGDCVVNSDTTRDDYAYRRGEGQDLRTRHTTSNKEQVATTGTPKALSNLQVTGHLCSAAQFTEVVVAAGGGGLARQCAYDTLITQLFVSSIVSAIRDTVDHKKKNDGLPIF